MRNSLPTGLSYEGKLEHVIEHIVLNTVAPQSASAAEIRTAICEFAKTLLRVNELEIPSDAVIDEIARELIEWHAPRPDEEGYEAAAATPEQCLMAANRHRADDARAEQQREFGLHEAERAETARQEKFKRVRENAERRRARGDHEGADFLEQWIKRQTATEPVP